MVNSESTNLLNEKQAAAMLGMSYKTLQAWRWSRKGPSYCKIGRAVRYKLDVLKKFIDSCDRQSEESGI